MEKIALTGFEKLLDYGLAIAIASICAVALFYLLKMCERRFEKSLELHKDMTAQVSKVVQKNTEAFESFKNDLKSVKTHTAKAVAKATKPTKGRSRGR